MDCRLTPEVVVGLNMFLGLPALSVCPLSLLLLFCTARLFGDFIFIF